MGSKKRKYGDMYDDSDDSDVDHYSSIDKACTKAMRKKCPTDIVGPEIYKRLEALGDPLLDTALRIEANNGTKENTARTILSKIVYHANTPSGMMLNLFGLVLGRREKIIKIWSSEFDDVKRLMVQQPFDPVHAQDLIQQLKDKSMEYLDEPMDLLRAIFIIHEYSDSYFFRTRIENLVKGAHKDKFEEPLGQLIQDSKLLELIKPERITQVLDRSSIIALQAGKDAKKYAAANKKAILARSGRGAFRRSDLLGAGDEQPKLKRVKGVCDKDTRNKVCTRKDCKFKHPLRDELKKAFGL